MGVNQLVLSNGHSSLITAIWEEMLSKLWWVPSIWTMWVLMPAEIHEAAHSGKNDHDIDKVAYKEVNFKSKLIQWDREEPREH